MSGSSASDDVLALRESEERFRATFEQAAVGVAHVSREGRWVRVNAKLGEILGYSREELENLSFADVSLPADASRGVEALGALFGGTLAAYSVDKQYVKKDGSLVWVHLTATPARDAEGRIGYVISFIEDIGARKAAEAAGQRSLSLLEATIESTADGILVVDAAGKIARYNHQFAAMWRIPEEVLASGDDDEAIRFVIAQLAEPESFIAKVRELYASPNAESFDELRFEDGRVFERYSKPQRLGDSTVGRVWSFRDVSARRRAELALRKSEEQLRQSQKMEAVGRLAGGVAHDFNNLLLVISACADVAQKSVSTEDRVAGLLDEIQTAAQRAAGLTRQLLAFSRQQVLEPRIVDVNALVLDTSEMLRRMIGEDVDLETRLDAAAFRVMLDPGQVAQVLMNLAVNARDAMPAGGKLTIETANVELDAVYAAEHAGVGAGAYVMIAVRDNGHGMDAKTQARLFEPFFTTKEQGKGTGLGLSTVYGIVKQSGGSISVDSEVGGGTTFKVYFPRATSSAELPVRPSAESVPARGTETVLLVEDEKAVRAVVQLLLEDNGYTVLAASGPDEAIAIAERHTGAIKIMLTDVVMPRMNGPQVAARVAALHPEVRVVYMSGYTPNAVVQHGVIDGDIAFLQKPFTEAALVRKLRSLLTPSK